MGVEATERGNFTIEADRVATDTTDQRTRSDGACDVGSESARPAVGPRAGRPGTWFVGPKMPTVGLQVTQDRVLIRADREDKAPTQTSSGLYVAQSLAAAVDGSDSGESWFVGTIVQLGPLVRRLDVREIVLDWLQAIVDEGHSFLAVAEIKALRTRIQALPQEHIDPLAVGDRVVFSWASGQQIAIGEDKYVVLRADDILGILDDEEGE